jgi:hypothetical protein
MAGPWEAYAPTAPASTVTDGPWASYQPQTQSGGVQTIPGQNGAPTRVIMDMSTAPKPEDRGSAYAATRGALNGMTTNFYDELKGVAAAGGAGDAEKGGREGIDHLIMGLAKYWFGDKDAEAKYNEAVGKERGLTKQTEEQHPIASTVGNIAGAVALPIGAYGQAATLPGRMAAGAGIGAVLGGAGGVGEGQGALDSISRGVTGAALGGGLGGAAPAVIEGVIRGGRAVAQPVANAVRGIRDTEGEAARRVATAVARDVNTDPNAISRITPQEFGASVQSGGPAMVMDLGGETTRALARSAANTSPEGRAALSRTINDRFEGQTARVSDWFRNSFHFPDADAQSQALSQVSRNVNTPNYARAMADGSRGVWTPELQRLAGAPAIQEAARAASPGLANRGITEGFQAPRQNPFTVDRETGRVSLRQTASGNDVVPDLRFWDQVKRNLDSKIGIAERAGDRPKVGELTGIKNALLEQLDATVPSYQQARAGAAHFFGAQNALEAGQAFVGKNMSAAEARRGLAAMSPTERQLFQDGFVSKYVEDLNKVGDRRSILNKIAESPAAREKLHIAIGRPRAEELEAGLRVEGIMDLARSAVQGNSTTARQLAELGLAGGAYTFSGGGINPFSDPTAAMNAALVYGAARGKGRINENVSRRVAELLTSQDPAIFRRGIQMVARNQNLFNSLRSADRGIARVSGESAPTTGILSMGGVSRAEDQQSAPRPPGQ